LKENDVTGARDSNGSGNNNNNKKDKIKKKRYFESLGIGGRIILK